MFSNANIVLYRWNFIQNTILHQQSFVFNNLNFAQNISHMFLLIDSNTIVTHVYECDKDLKTSC